MQHIETLKKRLALLRSQYTDTQALKQFREACDPAREAFLMIIRARMDEILKFIKLLTDGRAENDLLHQAREILPKGKA